MTHPRVQLFDPPFIQWSAAVWHAELARAIDTATSSDFGIPATTLIERAGKAIADAALDWGGSKHPILVLCGRGNNGADGLVAGRLLHAAGSTVQVFVMPGSSDPSKTFAHYKTLLEQQGVPVRTWEPGMLSPWQAAKPVVIDALVGIGYKPRDNDTLQDILTEAAKIAKTSTIAVDLPSGISSDHGDGIPLLPADVTITFGAAKPCHVLMPGATYCGQVIRCDIGFPAEAEEHCGIHPWLREVRPDAVLHLNPWQDLPRDANKYDRGHVLVIGGSEGKTGAPVLAGMAALRCGAGWVSVAPPQGNIPVDRPIPWELTIESLFDGECVDSIALAEFISARKIRSIVIGPGWMKQHLDAKSLLVLQKAALHGVGVVIDAGALHGVIDLLQENFLAHPELQKHHSGRTPMMLTPHPGEWRKLTLSQKPLPAPHSAVAYDEVCEALAKVHVVAAYKDAAPVVCSTRPGFVCTSGSNVLARAGSGDVLTGVIAAHLARGTTPMFAFARGFALMARAALGCAQSVGADAVTATDIIEELGVSARI